MTKQEAYAAMQQGHKVRHEYYSPEEYVFINKKGNFQTEDGYDQGGIYDEFWFKYQKWETGWSIYEEK
jgi:hypothetical protein